MNHSEAVAQLVVESVIPGSRMVYRAEQSQGVHDFDLYYDDGRIAAVEVTESVSTARKETDAAIVSSRKGGQRIKAKLCRKPWRIRPGTGANINRIREVVDRYLAEVESAGIDHFFSASDRHKSAVVDNIYRDLQIYSGDILEWEAPGYITIGLPIEGATFGGTVVHDAVMVEALKPDNRRKLASAGTSETHLVVFVDVLNHRVWTSLVYSTPPSEATDLPEEITDAWALGQGESENQYIVWRARRGSAWYRLEPVTAQLPRQGGPCQG
jgi:hypothetical protein